MKVLRVEETGLLVASKYGRCSRGCERRYANECKVVVEQSCHEARECVMEANGHRIGASHELYISYEE
jgi:hypothetical protein